MLRLGLATKNGCQRPEGGVTINAAEVLFGKQPSGSDPALHHIGITPASHVVRAALDSTLRALDDVGGRQTLSMSSWKPGESG